MHIIDDICYADEMTEEIKVKTAKALKGGIILVEFTTGEKRLFDTTVLTGSVFEPLKDEKMLSDMDIFHGVITWNNREIDIAPETVYEYSYPYCDAKSDYGVVNYNELVTK